MEVIQSEEGNNDSHSDIEPDDLSDDQDDIERYEEIDVKNVGLESAKSSNKRRKQKALLSPEQIAQAHQERENEASEKESIECLMK